MPEARFSKRGFRIILLPLVLTILCEGQAPRPEPVTDQETELGHEIYQELTDKGQIIESSPLYETLKPLAGDCCVFCSFGSVKCPPIQRGDPCCS